MRYLQGLIATSILALASNFSYGCDIASGLCVQQQMYVQSAPMLVQMQPQYAPMIQFAPQVQYAPVRQQVVRQQQQFVKSRAFVPSYGMSFDVGAVAVPGLNVTIQNNVQRRGLFPLFRRR